MENSTEEHRIAAYKNIADTDEWRLLDLCLFRYKLKVGRFKKREGDASSHDAQAAELVTDY